MSVQVVAFAFSGLVLILMPQIHASIREANALYAVGISRYSESGQADAPLQLDDLIADLGPVPSAIHWASIGAGAASLVAAFAIGASCIQSGRNNGE